MRKPVVLITGAGGEIGHGLVTRLARGRLAHHHARRQPARCVAGAARHPRVHRLDHRHRPARPRAGGVRGGPRVSSRGAAVDAVRVHAGDRASRQRRGHAQPARVRAAPGRVARPSGGVHLSVVDCRVRPAESRREGARRARHRGSVRAADDDVRVQQAVLRAARPLLRAPLQAAVGRRDRARRLSLRALSGPDLGDDAAVRRHLGLRAGDDPRRRARASRTSASSGPTPRFRSWRCPTASTRC